MAKFITLIAVLFGVYMCNRVDSTNTATFIKVCRYNCDSALICKDYFFTQIDSAKLDSLGVKSKAKAYTGSQPSLNTLQYLKKDTLVFILN